MSTNSLYFARTGSAVKNRSGSTTARATIMRSNGSWRGCLKNRRKQSAGLAIHRWDKPITLLLTAAPARARAESCHSLRRNQYFAPRLPAGDVGRGGASGATGIMRVQIILQLESFEVEYFRLGVRYIAPEGMHGLCDRAGRRLQKHGGSVVYYVLDRWSAADGRTVRDRGLRQSP